MTEEEVAQSVQESARSFVECDEAVRTAEEHVKQLKQRREKLREQLIDDMLYQEVPSVEVFAPDGGRARVYPISRVFARRNKNLPESEFFDGLRAAGFEHLIKDQVNTNSLSAVVRELADDADVRDGTSSVISAALPNELSKIVTIDTSLTLGIRRV